MKSMHIKFNSDGFKEILCSDGVRDLVAQSASEICARANENDIEGKCGFYTGPYIGNYGGGRWVDTIRPENYSAARKAEAEDKVLSRAVF